MNSKCEHGMEFECTECLAKSGLLLERNTPENPNMMTKFDLLLAYTVRKGELTTLEDLKAQKLYEELGEFIMRYQK